MTTYHDLDDDSYPYSIELKVWLKTGESNGYLRIPAASVFRVPDCFSKETSHNREKRREIADYDDTPTGEEGFSSA